MIDKQDEASSEASNETQDETLPEASAEASAQCGIYHPLNADYVFGVFELRRNAHGQVDVSTSDGYIAVNIPIREEIDMSNSKRWYVPGKKISDYDDLKTNSA